MNPLRWLFRRGRIEGDLDTEIRSHFEMAIAERIAAGEDPESARLAAINEFGNPLQMKEDARAVWRGGLVALVADVWQDVRFGVRMLPGTGSARRDRASIGSPQRRSSVSSRGLHPSCAAAFATPRPVPFCSAEPSTAAASARICAGLSRHCGSPTVVQRPTASMMVFAGLGRGVDAERVIAELVVGNY
jgi:hypothetical protein